MSNEYFFRNDDIRQTLDKSLITIQRIFKERKIPIIFAVEPANVSKEVVDWLLQEKKQHPELIDIMQHGYDHKIKNRKKKGEFGGDRTYKEQYDEILKGKELMDSFFGDAWFPMFNFPYAPYNKAAIQALQDIGYKVINSHYNIDWKRRLFYVIGHILGKGLLFDHHVSWNMKKYPGTTMYEISMNISFIKQYYNEQTNCEFYTYNELCNQIDQYSATPFPVGLLLHHRYHTTVESISLIERVLDYLSNKHMVPKNIENIYKSIEKGNK